MRLQDIMSTDVETIDVNESADVAWNRMALHDIRHLVVLKDRDVVGVLTNRDLGGSHGDSLRAGKRVGDLMVRDIAVAQPTTTVREAANLLRGRTIGCLPVLEGKTLKGIVTIADLLELVGRGVERAELNPERRVYREGPPHSPQGRSYQ